MYINICFVLVVARSKKKLFFPSLLPLGCPFVWREKKTTSYTLLFYYTILSFKKTAQKVICITKHCYKRLNTCHKLNQT